MKKMNKIVLGLLFISSTIILAACGKTKNVNESPSKESTESTVGESTTETTSVEYTTAADTSAEDTSVEDTSVEDTSVEESPSATAADNAEGTLNDADNDMPSSETSEKFTAPLYAALKDEWSCSGYISAENRKTNVSVGGMDMESSENLWDYFMSLLNDWELTDVVGSLNDFTDYDGLLLISSGNENLYSDRAWIAANDQATIAIGYDDASFDSNRNLYHSGNYHDLIIRLDYDGYTYLFDLTK